MGEFFNELKRRNVFRVAAAYLVSAWLIIQVVETTFPPFGFGDGAIRAVVIALSIGLIPVLVIAWVFELTPEGLKMDSDVDPARSVTRTAGRKLDRAIVAVLVLAVGYFAVDKFMLDPNRDAEQLELAREAVRNEAIIAEIGDRSIAVLPFADMSQERDQAYFSEGIAEELLNLLATIPEVRVTSRSSAFSFKDKGLSIPEIADRLRVSYVLDGSVRKSGDQLRISAQLIDAQTDTQVWSRNFDRTLENIFQIQDEIAGDVVEQVRGTLDIASPQQRQTDPVAYSLFLEARDQRRLGTVDSYDKSIAIYKRVLEIDPNYSPAWDEMAAVYQNQANTGLRPAAEGFRLAREAALAAIEADPSYAPALGTLAFMAQYYDVDLAAATEYLQRALELAPTDSALIGSAGMLLKNMGRAEEGLAPIEYTVALDPLSAAWQYTLGLAYSSAGQYDDAVRSFETTLRLSPEFSLAHYNLGVTLMLAGRPNEAVAALQKEAREDWRLAALTMAYAAANNDYETALAELLRKYSGNMTYNIGYVYAYLGDADSAFEWLERAFEVEDPGLGEILSQPLFANLKEDPRWLPLLEKLGRAPDQLSEIQLSVTIPQSQAAQ
jgi:TolB-like protein/Tfp pilus assembly protein PilF